MASVQELEDALRNADKAGDVDAARRLADALVEARSAAPEPASQEPTITGPYVPHVDNTGMRAPVPRVGFAPQAGQVGAAPPEAMEAASVGAGLPAVASQEPPDATGSMGRAAAQGLTFGTADEALAGTRSLMGQGSYGDLLEEERGRLEELTPRQRIAMEVMGSLPWAGLGAGWAGNAKTLRGLALRSSALTGGMGTAYGAGSGEGGAGNRAVNAAAVGVPSAALGAAIPYGAVGLQKAGRWAGNQFSSARDRLVQSLSGNMPEFSTAADRKLAEAAMREFPGLPAREAMAAADAERALIGPEATYADVGPNFRGLTAAIERQPGKAKTIIRDKIIPRQEGTRDPATQALEGGQAGRVDEFLNRLVPENTTATRETLSTSTDEVKQLYNSAYSANQRMDSPEIRRILKTPLAKRAFNYAVRRMQNRGQNVSPNDPELTALYRDLVNIGRMEDVGIRGVGRGLKLRTLDLLKRSLDDMGKASPTATGTAKGMASDARALAKQLRNELDRLDETAKAGPKSFKAEGGDYAKARKIEERRFAAKEALMDGEKFLARGTAHNPDELRAATRDMTPDELHKMRISFIGALKTRAGDAKRWLNATRNLYGDKNLEDKIRLIFGDDETFARYIRFMEGSEAPMFETYAAITKGSPTVLRLAEDADAKVLPGLLAEAGREVIGSPLSPGAWLRAGGKTLKAAGQRLGRDPAMIREQMARALMEPQMPASRLERAAGSVELSDANRRALVRALSGLETQRAREQARSSAARR